MYKLVGYPNRLIKKYTIQHINQTTLNAQEQFAREVNKFIQTEPEEARGRGWHEHICLFKMLSNDKRLQKQQCREWRNLHPIIIPEKFAKNDLIVWDNCDFCPMMCYVALDDEGKLMYAIR